MSIFTYLQIYLKQFQFKKSKKNCNFTHRKQSNFVFITERLKKLGTNYQNIHQDIINECLKGNRDAQFELYKLYYKAMYNTSLRIIADAAEAEDIMQEAFLAAFDKLASYKREVAFGAWLKRIVVNKSLDFVKKRKIDFESIEEVEYSITESSDETSENDSSKQVELVKKAIKELNDGYRIVLSLYLLEGYDHDEIAEIMGITASTSRSQLARAKKKLIAIINQKQKT